MNEFINPKTAKIIQDINKKLFCKLSIRQIWHSIFDHSPFLSSLEEKESKLIFENFLACSNKNIGSWQLPILFYQYYQNNFSENKMLKNEMILNSLRKWVRTDISGFFAIYIFIKGSELFFGAKGVFMATFIVSVINFILLLLAINRRMPIMRLNHLYFDKQILSNFLDHSKKEFLRLTLYFGQGFNVFIRVVLHTKRLVTTMTKIEITTKYFVALPIFFAGIATLNPLVAYLWLLVCEGIEFLAYYSIFQTSRRTIAVRF